MPAPQGHRKKRSWVESDLEQLSVQCLDSSPERALDQSRPSRKGRIDACGYLLKRRAFIGGYARRYFVVEWPLLSYWISAEDQMSGNVDARGIFDLSKCRLGRGNGAFDMTLHYNASGREDAEGGSGADSSKRWVLQASSQAELERWMDALGRGQ